MPRREETTFTVAPSRHRLPNVQPSLIGVEIGDRTVIAFASHTGRIAVHLIMPGIDRQVDVTASPATATRAVLEEAAAARIPASQAIARCRTALDQAAHHAAIEDWSATRTAVTRAIGHVQLPPRMSVEHYELHALLGAAAFPILRAATQAGATPLGDIPRWAFDALAARHPRDAANAAFGAKASRRVTAAFAGSLFPQPPNPDAPDTAVDLARLCMALMGAPALEPDEIATVLELPTIARPASTLPDRRGIDAVRAMVDRWPARTIIRIFTEVLADTRGIDRLSVLAAHWFELGDNTPRNPPRHLRELEDVCLQRMPASTRLLEEPPRPARRRPARQTRTIRQTRTTRRQPTAAPPVDQTPPPHRDPAPPAAPPVDQTPLAHPDQVPQVAPRVDQSVTVSLASRLAVSNAAAAIDGQQCGPFTVVVPRIVADLDRWGRIMRNCLGSYGPAAHTGASTLIGFEQLDTLRYVAEITPNRRLGQLLGRANARPSDDERTTIIRFLFQAGLLAHAR